MTKNYKHYAVYDLDNQQEIETQAAQPPAAPEPEAPPPAQGQNITITHKSAK